MYNVMLSFTEAPSVRDALKSKKGKRGKKRRGRHEEEEAVSRPVVDTTAELPEVSILSLVYVSILCVSILYIVGIFQCII